MTEATKQRQDLIDEGVTIAEKVDKLRRTLADIQRQHTEYIAGMKAQIEKELGPLIQEKRELEVSISVNRAVVESLYKPLNQDRAQVEKDRAEVAKAQIDLNIKESQLVAAEADIDKQKVETDRLAVAALKLHEDAQVEVDRAADVRDEADLIMAKARDYYIAKTSELDDREHDIAHTENELYIKSVNLSLIEENLTAREIALNDREKYINDKYETLQRTINRLNT